MIQVCIYVHTQSIELNLVFHLCHQSIPSALILPSEMSQKSPLPNANSPISLSSWPIIKYSHSVSSLSSSTQPPWTHFAHRDNIFLVIDIQRVPGYIQNDGKFSDQKTRLKVVWGLETLVSTLLILTLPCMLRFLLIVKCRKAWT